MCVVTFGRDHSMPHNLNMKMIANSVNMPNMLLQMTICPARCPSPPISVDMTIEDTACGETAHL